MLYWERFVSDWLLWCPSLLSAPLFFLFLPSLDRWEIDNQRLLCSNLNAGSAGVSYGAKALVNLCLGLMKLMNGR